MTRAMSAASLSSVFDLDRIQKLAGVRSWRVRR